MSQSYAGDVLPQEAWDILQRDGAAQLIDVRTEPEWAFVGLPDLTSLQKEVLCLSWQVYPMMQINETFAQDLARCEFRQEQTLLFICRSGVRSRHAAIALTDLGYQRCYNVAEGFEGDRGNDFHRAGIGGWKHAGLPWTQS